MISSSHPATKQDTWVIEALRDLLPFAYSYPVKSPFTALELGGYDGVTHSNTLQLETVYGARCTLIEAVPYFFNKMKKNRPKAKCINAAIAGSPANLMRFYCNGEWSGLVRDMPEACIREHEARNSVELTVDVRPLSHYIEPCHFNYISLDTEGSEAAILEAWVRQGGTCDALTVEFNFDADRYYKLCRIAEKADLELVEVRGFDLCFLRKGLR